MPRLSERILQIVQARPGLTARQIADLLARGGVCLEDRTVYNRLNTMLGHGKVVKEKSILAVVGRMVIAKRQRAIGTSVISRPQSRTVQVVVWKVAT